MAALLATGCETKHLNRDMDQSDFGVPQRCYSGENVPTETFCARPNP